MKQSDFLGLGGVCGCLFLRSGLSLKATLDLNGISAKTKCSL